MFRAIRVKQFGGIEQLQCHSHVSFTAPMMENHVRVQLKYAGVNPVETYIRTGTHTLKPALPWTPGNDGSGIVQEIGKNVTHVNVGDRVYVSKSLTGTYAEQTLAAKEHVHHLPPELSFAQGAAIGTVYLTAYRALFQRAKAKSGESVLIHGASGGVGIASVQLAREHNMVVFGTASSEPGRQLVKDEGATYALDHSSPEYLKELRELTNNEGLDLILEMLANKNLSNDMQLLKRNGRIAIIGNRGPIEINPRELMNKESSIFGVYLPLATDTEMEEAYAALGKGFQSGLLKPVVGTEFRLEDAGLAHEHVLRSGAHGKVVLRCAE